MGKIGRILVAVFLITITASVVQGALVGYPNSDAPTPENGPEYPPGANSQGISNYSLLLSHHNTVVMEHNVIRNTSNFVRDIHFTTKIDRPDRQVFTRTDDGDPIPDERYYVNGSDIGGPGWGLEYSRTNSKGHHETFRYSVAGYSEPDELVKSNTLHYEISLQYGDWEMVSQRTVNNETHLTTYNYTGLTAGVDPDDLWKNIDSANITVRNDGLIVEYHERGNTTNWDYEKHVTTTVTDEDTVTEPSWIETAEREEASDDNNWHECGPDDIDRDDDGLCNER